jgi:hypothetical protein
MRLFDHRAWRAPRPADGGVRNAVPAGFEAVAEALQAGVGSVDACLVAGRRLADDGTSLHEALRGLRATTLAAHGVDPAYADVEALCLAWSESTLGYLHQLSCEDPLTGLASLAHVRSRLSELYRGELRQSGSKVFGRRFSGRVRENYALVVMDLPAPPVADHDPSEDGVTRALQLAQLGVTARTVFPGNEVAGRLGLRRIGVLATRDAHLGRRVAVLRQLTAGVERIGHPARVWIEGLPETDAAAAQLLDELAHCA